MLRIAPDAVIAQPQRAFVGDVGQQRHGLVGVSGPVQCARFRDLQAGICRRIQAVELADRGAMPPGKVLRLRQTELRIGVVRIGLQQGGVDRPRTGRVVRPQQRARQTALRRAVVRLVGEQLAPRLGRTGVTVQRGAGLRKAAPGFRQTYPFGMRFRKQRTGPCGIA